MQTENRLSYDNPNGTLGMIYALKGSQKNRKFKGLVGGDVNEYKLSEYSKSLLQKRASLEPVFGSRRNSCL